MSTSTSNTASCTPPSSRSALLASVATAVDLVLVESGRALAVGLIDHGDELSLATRRLDDHPVDELLGFTAPDEWWGFGVAATGHGFPVPDDSAPAGGSPIPANTAVRIVHLVGRTGATHSLLSIDESQVLDVGSTEVSGLVDDVCRRALGLPTAPPDCNPSELWARLWLEQVLATPSAPGTLGWSQIVQFHPAVQQVRRADPGMALLAAGDVELAGRAMADAWSWEDLRLLRSCGQSFELPVSPAHAAWMDEGMFSRMVLSSFADLGDLLEAAVELLPRAVGARVVGCLRSWGLEPDDRPHLARPSAPSRVVP